MMKVRVLSNKVIRSPDTEPSPAVVPVNENAPINSNESIENELKKVLGESLDVPQEIYKEIVEEEDFPFDDISPANTPSSAFNEQHKQRPKTYQPRGKKQQYQQQLQQQQKRPQIRRGQKDLGKKRKLFELNENESMSSANSDFDDDFEIKRPASGSASAVLLRFKKEYGELAQKYSDELVELKAEFRRVSKRREWLIKRMNEVESEKSLVDKTLKQIK